MPLAHITFKSKRESDHDSLGNAASWYAACLWKNGQISPDYIVCEVGSAWRLTVYFNGPEAHLPRSHSGYARKSLKDAIALCGRAPLWTIAASGPDTTDGTASWTDAPSLFLCGPDFDASASSCFIRRGDNGKVVPLFTIPINEIERERLSGWCDLSRELNSIWLRTSVLEMPSYRALAEASGSHVAQGREFCAEIELATSIPTFLDIKRYYVHKAIAMESTRRCPGCGGTWDNVTDPAPEELYWFDFRCDRCRLVQQAGCSFSGNRLARIGNWKPGKAIPAASHLLKNIKAKKTTLS